MDVTLHRKEPVIGRLKRLSKERKKQRCTLEKMEEIIIPKEDILRHKELLGQGSIGLLKA